MTDSRTPLVDERDTSGVVLLTVRAGGGYDSTKNLLTLPAGDYAVIETELLALAHWYLLNSPDPLSEEWLAFLDRLEPRVPNYAIGENPEIAS